MYHVNKKLSNLHLSYFLIEVTFFNFFGFTFEFFELGVTVFELGLEFFELEVTVFELGLEFF